jgi:hypothetical protein
MAGGERLPKDPIKNYHEAHWGHSPTRKYHVQDDDLPEVLVEMGKLLEIHLEDGRDIVFQPGNMLPYATTPDTRLYFVLSQTAQRKMKQLLWDPKAPVFPLSHIAKLVGGRQARYPYPDVLVQPVSLMTDVVYRTTKGRYDEDQEEPDGLSEYIHKFGELNEGTGELPMVCVDHYGRLWLAGGAYKTLRGGITG